MTRPTRTIDPTVLVDVSEVSKTYADGTTALHHIDLRVGRGEFLAVIGPSGSGKSSLLNLLGVLDTPSQGTVIVCGHDVGTLSERDKDILRSVEIGFVFQSAHVLGDESVITNAAMGLQIQGAAFAERRLRAADIIRDVGLTQRTEAPARLLSGGERQRLAIARTLATDPALILADEPTGSLDTENGEIVMGLLEDARRRGTTIVVITHDPQVAARADRQIVLSDGRIDQRTADPVVSNRLARDFDTLEGIATAELDTVPDAPATLSPPEPAASEPRTTATRGLPETAVVRPLRRRPFRWGSLLDLLVDAVSALSARPLRSMTLIAAFALGIGGLLVSMGISLSVAQQVDLRLQNAGLNTVEARLDSDRQSGYGAEAARAAEDRLLALPHVREAGFWSPIEPADARVSPGWMPPSDTESRVGAIIASARFLELAATKPVSNVGLLDSDLPVAFIAEDAAQTLDLPIRSGSAGAGVQVWVQGRLVDVVGTFDTDPSRPELNNAVVLSNAVFDRDLVQVRYSVITDRGFPAAVSEAVAPTVFPADPERVDIATTADLRQLRSGISSDLAGLVAVLSTVLLILVCLSAATVMFLSVNARTAEIALRRALGLSRRSTATQFLLEGTIVGLTGGAVAGAVGAFGVVSLGILQQWQPVVSPWSVPLGLVLGTVTGVLSAAYPAWVASRKDPAIALRE